MTLDARPTAIRRAELPLTERVCPPSAHVLAVTRRPLLRALRAWWDVRVHDDVFLPLHGPCIVAANHVGTLDGPLAVATSPRPTFALAKSELFTGAVGWALRTAGQIPLARDHADADALRTAVRVLRDGNPLVIFPEGARDGGDFEQIRGGLAYLALVTGAPIVPCAMLGTRLPGASRRSIPARGSQIDVVYGHPIQVAAQSWPRTRPMVADLTVYLRERLVEHVEGAQQRTGQRLPGKVPAHLLDR